MDDLTPANVAILLNSMNQLSSSVNLRMDSFEKNVSDQIGNLATAFLQANNGHRESIKELYQENKNIRDDQASIRLDFTKQLTDALMPIRNDIQGIKTEVAEIKAVKKTEDIAETKVDKITDKATEKSRFTTTQIVVIVSVIIGALATVIFGLWLMGSQNDKSEKSEKQRTEKVDK